MTSAAVLKQSGPRHLLADDISYIALEGGGGKGFAYLGDRVSFRYYDMYRER